MDTLARRAARLGSLTVAPAQPGAAALTAKSSGHPGPALKALMLVAMCLLPVIAWSAEGPGFAVGLGAIELEFTDAGLDVVKWRDRYVVGDHFDDPRPAFQVLLLTKGWETLACPRQESARPAVVDQSQQAVVVRLAGEMFETGGTGRWQWEQEWTVSRSGILRLDSSLRQLVAPTAPWWLHRFSLIGNRSELFVRHPNQDENTPGKPIPIRTRDGRQVAPLFGGEDNIVTEPAEVRLPFAGHEVILRPDAQTRSVELWNGWWRQCINFELPVAEEVHARLALDLSGLPQVPDPELSCAPLPHEEQPWLTADLAPLPPVDRVLRCAQGAPPIIAWAEVRRHSEEELERFYSEMARHFDILELGVCWTDWKWDLGWDRNEEARRHAEAIAEEVRKQVRIAHAHGVRIALSLNFGGSGPGVGVIETRRQPHFQGETFDPETGEFRKCPEFFDWANPEAVAAARRAFLDCARLVGPVDYLFFNENLWRMDPWYEVPLFSEAALADFREFVGDPTARFPAKPWAADSPRTNNRATHADWARWYDWAQACFARSIRVQAEAFAEANRNNPNYGGAIYFQHAGWTGPKYAVDLDRIAAIPEVTWLCAEYVTDATSPLWRKFRYCAARHGKKLSSFVNVGYYDSNAPGRVRYEGTDEAFAEAVRMGLRENVPMITLYPADSLDSASPAYHPTRTAIWSQLTAPRDAAADRP
ncbi:MAG: hypothetical protein N2512_08335 [Armatimonadetes bacterium]|nr:hypothetical protein [Armatimonadota bacterium]